ncbi:type IV secretion system protein [Phaeobacter inhibens]|uniref:type IV secretion system protein n=1 Tax=Phaeobacter inhibens TaxID=221822 RepID=UPI0021A49B47|nr:type IV secretion system protein [Phaeobacter inhibens]UWR62806.1 type IV secretion system protein [Phaeobacter inhibens]
MATFITDALNSIDAAIAGYAQSVFGAFAGPVTGMLQAMGVVGLAFIAANSLMQFYPIRVGEYIKWSVRYIAILAVATSWAQFLPIYNIITNVPSSVAAGLLAQTGAPTLNVALDQMVTGIFAIGDDINSRAGTFDVGMALTSVIMTILGAFMACIAIIVSAVAKIGLALAVSLAPIFISALMFRPTSDLFTSWSRFTLGFALIPVALAGIMGAVIGVGQSMIVAPGSMNTLGDAAGFLIVVLAGIIMMSQIPTIVNSLAGGIVATASGVRQAQIAGNSVKSLAKTGGRTISPRVAQASSAIGAARHAEGGAKERALAALADARSTQAAMKDNKEKFRQRSARLGRNASHSEVREAGHAGMRQAARENAASRKSSPVKFANQGPATLPKQPAKTE